MRLLGFLAVLFSPGLALAASDSVLEQLDAEVRALTKRVSPAVVRIEAKTKRVIRLPPDAELPLPTNPTVTASRVGTGFVVGERRLILASRSLVVGATSIEVTFSDGTMSVAEVLGSAEFFRVAVLRARVPDGVTGLELAADAPEAGSLAMAFGHAFDAGPSRSLGVVCGSGRSHFGFDNFLVVSTPFTPGDGGAAVVDVKGRVLGLASAALSARPDEFPSVGRSRGMMRVGPGQIACCVPAEDLGRVLADIQKNGDVESGWLGVTLKRGDSAISGVVANSPAGEAGLRPGDRIVEMDGRPVPTRTALLGRLARLRPDVEVRLIYVREGQRHTLAVRLRMRPQEESQDFLLIAGGVKILRLPPELQERPIGLEVGDVVLFLNGKRVAGPEALREALERYRTGEDGHLKVYILRNGTPMEIEASFRR
jgi:S1-C subfamily serine protease